MVRRLLAATLLAALVLVGACNNTGDTSEKSGSADAPATASPSPSRADNTKQVCADIEALNTELKQKVVALLQRALTELASGDEAKSEKTIEEMATVLTEYAGKVEALGATATNPELKQVLTTLAAELKKANEETVEDVTSAAEAKYKAICGG